MKESWNPVEGYEGYYEVSSIGRVRSVTRTISQGSRYVTLQGRVLKPSIRDGYVFVGVSKEGKTTTLDVHRLVAKAFIPNPDPSMYVEVNHKDRNKENNNVSNLEWVTHKQNVEHAKMTRMHTEEGKQRIREGSKHSKRLRPVRCVETGDVFPSITAAGKSNLPISHAGVESSLYAHKSVNGLTFVYEEVERL